MLGQLAAMRVPDMDLLADESRAPTLREAAERWLASRIDVAENTRGNHRSAVAAIVPVIGSRRLDSIEAADVAELVASLCETRRRETVRKMLLVLGMIFDHAVSHRTRRGTRPQSSCRSSGRPRSSLRPPITSEAVHDLLPTRYRLPLLVLDATGMRLGELEGLTWGDVDESRTRWRVSQAVSKTGRARWVNVAPVVFDAVMALVPRDDRTPDRPVFQGFGGDRFRTAVTRACTAAGVPAFSPHDLRHRRISLLHLGGVPWARIGEHVGQRNLAVTANTYSHVLADEAELDYAELLA